MDLYAELMVVAGLSAEACERLNAPVTRALARETELATAAARRADLTVERAADTVTPNRVAEIVWSALVQWVRHAVEPIEYLTREGGRTAEERAALEPIARRIEREALSLRIPKIAPPLWRNPSAPPFERRHSDRRDTRAR
jgi:hypothetical protein